MSAFAYTARNKAGQVIKGTLEASDRTAASSALTSKGLTPILVKPNTQSLLNFNLSLGGMGGKVGLEDRVIFSRQFATMINAGVPIVQSLRILREQTSNKKFQDAISDIAKRVEGGSTLATAMANHTDVFSAIYINMVKAGESGGILDEVLDRLAEQQERDAEIVGKIRGAMIYPGVITTVTIGAFVFLMTVIVPQLGGVFQSMGAQLPIYTRIMLAASHILIHYGIYAVIALVIAGFFGAKYIRTKEGKYVFDSLMLRAPIFGPIIKKVNVARFARTFGSLMASGISVLEALQSTASALGNSVYQRELLELAEKVKNGKSLSEPLKESKHFPPLVAQMVAVGEETGQLDKILIKLAGFFEKEVDAVINGITSVIEPILIIVIGTMVGLVVISVFGPISNLDDVVH